MKYLIICSLLLLSIFPKVLNAEKKFLNTTAGSTLTFGVLPNQELKFGEAPKLESKVVKVKQKRVAISKVMDAIKWCESRGNPKARNPRSTAKGLYQFLDGSFEYYGTKYWGSTKGKSALNSQHNEELAAYVMRTVGTSPWLASAHCWRPRLALLS